MCEQDTQRYRQALAANERDDRAVRAYLARPTTLVRLLVPVRISGPVRPAGTVVDILAADAVRLVSEGKAESFDS